MHLKILPVSTHYYPVPKPLPHILFVIAAPYFPVPKYLLEFSREILVETTAYVCIRIGRFILRNWLLGLCGLVNSKSEIQAGKMHTQGRVAD